MTKYFFILIGLQCKDKKDFLCPQILLWGMYEMCRSMYELLIIISQII